MKTKNIFMGLYAIMFFNTIFDFITTIKGVCITTIKGVCILKYAENGLIAKFILSHFNCFFGMYLWLISFNILLIIAFYIIYSGIEFLDGYKKYQIFAFIIIIFIIVCVIIGYAENTWINNLRVIYGN